MLAHPVAFDVQEAFDQSDKFFPTQLQKFQFYDKYSRFDHALGRRETWCETVGRAVDFLYELAGDRLSADIYNRIHAAILEMRVMPSMRLLAMAGPSARRSNITIYNCSAQAVDSLDSFPEALIISMSGCGVGYSVERHHVEKLPVVQPQTGAVSFLKVEDTSEGWASALRYGLQSWFFGEDVLFDYSLIRPAGSILLTKGGRASGPEPLRHMLDFTRSRILARQGHQLRPLDCHDIMCVIGNAAVCGGVRRTAMISLFDFDDQEMRTCKSGDFERENNQRWNANNSAVWPDNLYQVDYVDFMMEMFRHGRGEPGIFNRAAAELTKPERRASAEWLTNPCAEINMRNCQFCNLSIAVARPDDDWETLKEKVELATIIGTIQSLATKFPGLRPEWHKNAEEERLLGVDITGQMDCPFVQSREELLALQYHAVAVNKNTARSLNINPSAAITCVKPSGNSSQLLDCSPGLHTRWAPYYTRNVRVGAHTPVFHVLRDCGVPMHPENGQAEESATTWVAHFPVKSPDGAPTRNSRSAIEQCEYWKLNKVNWTEHNPSVTITYRPEEVLDILKWVWDNKDILGGMTFLPASDANYAQMPYEEITAEQYETEALAFPVIDFSRLCLYETSDMTTAAQELACVSGLCAL